MNTTKLLALATLSTMVCSTSASTASADSFKGADFLQLSEGSQHNYVLSSSMMAGVIASHNLPSQAKCIDAWVDKQGKRAFKPVTIAMKKFTDYHPTTVIFAVLQKACGKFKYVK